MTIKAEILADSVSTIDNSRLTTFRIQCPLYVWIDVLTHRILSRNASSSRAIPSKIWREMLRVNPAIPIRLTRYKKGMVSNEELDSWSAESVMEIYHETVEFLIKQSERLEFWQLSKQDANAISYGLQHVNAVITATDWGNFFLLRLSPEAKPDLQILAEKMSLLMGKNEPRLLEPGHWHLPFLSKKEEDYSTIKKLAVSAARCARVSYSAFGEDKLSDPEADMKLAETLASSGHMSPFEHQATPLPLPNLRCENFKGFISHRAYEFGSQQDEHGKAEPIKPQAAKMLLDSYL